jgi:nitrogen fixation protein FixH
VKRVQLALGAAVVAALGAIAGTVWVGAGVREETVVAKPYEEGLRHDDERRARSALGLSVAIDGEPLEAGAGPLAFVLSHRGGAPVDDAAVEVLASRPGTSRAPLAARARAAGAGRYVADLALPAAGPWDVRFDVVRGDDRVRLERRLAVRAACDVGAGPCTQPLAGGGEVTLELSPRPLRTMAALEVRVLVRAPGGAGEAERVDVSFAMPGMEMGANRAVLSAAGPGRWEGTAVLVRCPSGRRGWVADVAVARGASPARAARFALTVEE